MKRLRIILAILLASQATFAEVPAPAPGHSHQGAAFDEGPRSFAVLEAGMPDIDFDTPHCSPEAHDFIEQGIGQLHGFLNYESERSFRQAAFLDQNCVLAYWGMAMSSAVWIQNNGRALKFAKFARAHLSADSTERERLYVNSVEQLASGQTNEHLATLESIFTKYPNDLEAKAFYIVNYWMAQRNLDVASGLEYVSTQYSDFLFRKAKEILAVKPNHPVHHYVIHMWDSPSTFSNALNSADKSGFSGPGIAHLWHMAGHIYSLGRLPFEMWWSQEAAARVDHTYMKRSKIFPYWLHNHAHNNEWLSRTLMGLGNFGKAKAYAFNMLAQPRHPKLNRIDQYQHVQTGVLRAAEVLERGEYWTEANKLMNSVFMECSDFSKHQAAMQSCLRMKAITAAMTGTPPNDNLKDLSATVAVEAKALADIIANRNRDASFNRLRGLNHLQSGWGLSRLVRYAMYAEKPTIAAELANSLTAQDPSNVAFKLLAAATNAGASRSETARTHLASLQKISQELDESAPVNQEMIKILRDNNLISGTSVRKTYTGWRAIHASRPQHEALGSVLWQSIKAPNFEWTESDGTRHSLDEVAPNKPAIVTFVLGNCPRCDDQFALLDEKREELRAQGIELIAIASTPENIPAFKQMWSYDEFESIPIHGLFVINAQRDVVWQDINAEAFIDIDFLMKELPRSLSPLQPDMIKGTLSR